jgi:hypothetical protein
MKPKPEHGTSLGKIDDKAVQQKNEEYQACVDRSHVYREQLRNENRSLAKPEHEKLAANVIEQFRKVYPDIRKIDALLENSIFMPK